jgi:hypothetical protein
MAKYLPIIREPEYDGFKVIVPILPKLHSEWQRQHDAAVQGWIRDAGVPPIPIVVSLIEFEAYCGGHDPIGMAFWRFAEETARRQSASASSHI